MFVILLRFTDRRADASRWMEDHQAELQQGFEDGLFLPGVRRCATALSAGLAPLIARTLTMS